MELRTEFTTIEQARKLIKLGLPAETADCYIVDESDLNDELFSKYSLQIFNSEWQKAIKLMNWRNGRGYFPCWSVGQLVNICQETAGEDICFRFKNKDTKSNIDILMRELEYLTKQGFNLEDVGLN